MEIITGYGGRCCGRDKKKCDVDCNRYNVLIGPKIGQKETNFK